MGSSPGALRGLRTAAPLKQPLDRRLADRLVNSPRSSDRGSVEALPGADYKEYRKLLSAVFGPRLR